jgi:hypothetical protein
MEYSKKKKKKSLTMENFTNKKGVEEEETYRQGGSEGNEVAL